MKFKLLLSLFVLGIYSNCFAQLILTNAAPTAKVDFSASMQTTVGSSPSTAYNGSGFAPAPTVAGRLNSNAWEIKGWSFGDLLFGGTQTVDDFGRGSVSGGVITPGMYAFTNNPHTVANPMMLIQTAQNDFAPGTITLRIRNNGTANINQLTISYNLFVQNDENGSSSVNFSHSEDNISYTNESSLNYTTPATADAFQWVEVTGIMPSRSIILNGLTIEPGTFYYIRWTVADVVVSGDRDELGLDDINVAAAYGAPAPEINVQSYGNNLLSGDVTPTVAEGTDFAPIGSPVSTLLSQHIITYYIQNIGGAPLNISSVVITGLHASDFIITGTVPAGNIAPGGSLALSVAFDPSGPGLRQARVNIYNNDSNEGHYYFDVQGYGVVPIPDIHIRGGTPGGGIQAVNGGSMTPLVNNNTQFSTLNVGANEVKGFQIRNTCPYNAYLVLDGPSPYITISGDNPSDFTIVTSPSDPMIYPGEVRNFSIRFSPTASGTRSALVTILSNDPDVAISLPDTPYIESPFVFMVRGVGQASEIDITGNAQPIEHGALTTTLINHTFFDYLNVTTGTLDRTYTIRNTGNMALTLGALTLTGVNASDFSIVTNPGVTSLGVGLTTTFTIRFDPSNVGVRNAIVNLVNNDPNESPYTFAISGVGVDYIPCAFGPLETIATQNFETTPASPNWTYTTTGTSSVAGGTAYGESGLGSSTPRFLGARSLQVSNGSEVALFAGINTNLYSNIELNAKLASLAVTATEGSDLTDKVTIAVSVDGGAWSDEINVLGNANSKWGFSSGTGVATSAYDGNTIATVFNAGAGYATSNGFGTISITGLPKCNSLAVRITMTNDNANEIWALDNVSLFGRKVVSSTWNGSSWSPSVPTVSTKAIIDGNYNTSTFGNITACQCEIRAGRTVTIADGNFFSVGSELDNKGSLSIESGGSLVQQNDYANNIGSINVKRKTTYMRSFDFTYWSSPVVGQTLYNMSPNTRFDKYFSFDPIIGNWVTHNNGASVMQPAVGYIVRAPSDFDATPRIYEAPFAGIPNNGFIQTPIKIGLSDMNLIGNPYPSAINAISFLSNPANIGVVEGTIYLWTHNTGITNQAYNSDDYAIYNYSGSVATRPAINPGSGTGNNAAPSVNIASGQGFFIKGKTSNGLVTFNNSMRVTTGNNAFFKSAQTLEALSVANAIQTSEKNRIWLNLSNANGAFKQILVGYIDGATNGIDRGYDGEAIGGNSFIDLYSLVDSNKLAIQGRSLPFEENDKIVLGYQSSVAGTFEIGIENVDGFMEVQNIYLEDKLLQTTHDLKQSPYSFDTETGTFDNRFQLKYTNTALNNHSFIAEDNLQVAVKDHKITIRSQIENIKKVSIYDLLGRKVYEVNKTGQKHLSIQDPVRNEQAIVVKIELENGQIATRKILL